MLWLGRNYSCTHVMVGTHKYNIVCQPNLKLSRAITGLGQPIINPWCSQYLRLKFGLTEKNGEKTFFSYVITGYLFGRIKWNLTDLIVQLPYHVEHKKIKVLPCLCHPKGAFWIVQLFIFLASHSTRIHIFFKKINHWLNFLKKKRGMAPTFGPTFFVTNRIFIIIIVAWPIMHRLLAFSNLIFQGYSPR